MDWRFLEARQAIHGHLDLPRAMPAAANRSLAHMNSKAKGKRGELELKQVWSCGGGTQSIAIGALIIQGKLPVPDVAVIADTGREAAATWHYLTTVLEPAMAGVGLEIVRIAAAEWSYYHKTGHDLFNQQGTLRIPAFSTQTVGAVAKLPGYCSSAWKQEPIDRWLRSLGIKKSEAQIWIGYSSDEQRRWAKKMASEDYKRGLIRIPLVDDIPTTRNGCISIISGMGWPVPAPKSRCWMCPHQNDAEWLELSPEEFRAAIDLERDIRKRDPHAWLHRQCVPLDQVDFSKPEDLFSRACDSGACFV